MSQSEIELTPNGKLEITSDDVISLYRTTDLGTLDLFSVAGPTEYHLKLRDDSIATISEKTYNELRESLTISVWYIKQDHRIQSPYTPPSTDNADFSIVKIRCIRETETQVYTIQGKWINKTEIFPNIMSLVTRYGSIGGDKQRSVKETKRFLKIKGITDIKGLIKSIEAKLLSIPLIYVESNTYKTLVDTKKEELKLLRQLLELKAVIKHK